MLNRDLIRFALNSKRKRYKSSDKQDKRINIQQKAPNITVWGYANVNEKIFECLI